MNVVNQIFYRCICLVSLISFFTNVNKIGATNFAIKYLSRNSPNESKVDTVRSFNNKYVRVGIINNIKESTADVEIRVYKEFSKVSGIIQCIRSFKDSVFCSVYFYNNVYELGNLDDNCIPPIKNQFKISQLNEVLTIKTINSETLFNKYSDLISKTKILSITSQENIRDLLKTKKIKVSNPCESISGCDPHQLDYYEVKYFNESRNFNLLTHDYYLLNKSYKIFRELSDIKYYLSYIFLSNN